MKKFKYNHSALTYALLFIVMVATAVGLFFSVLGAINQIETTKIVAYAVLSAVNLFLFIAVLLIVVKSNYKVNKKFVTLSLGLFFIKYPIDKIVAITNLLDVKKLLVTLNDEKFFFVVISPDEFGNFSRAIKEYSEEVTFDATYTTPTKKS